ncbi:pyrroline-5-carboxylate reductase dimerization domain-containing protein [Kiloniella laminariae]|uniref:pyrroline-5-carboxylate reductase dimerization domain-containing protein n=1 Tax=Kiloniella laminariae TaxID=454162 RepID=UPI00146AB870|nr:pyrroline-5-carboxylate reductase dimerization domain-containing protein [Kiloniella laminariae]
MTNSTSSNIQPPTPESSQEQSLALPVLGVLGVGHFASYTIAGLRRGGFTGQIILSPRNAEIARALAKKHDCLIAKTNQEVVDRSGMLLLSVRPQHLADLLEALTFRPDQIIISAIAGISLEQHRDAGALPDQLVRMIPVCSIEAGEGVTPVFPPHPLVEALARFTGTPVSLENEKQFDLALAASCMNGWLYEFFGEMTDWMTAKGLPKDKAREMILHNIRGATAYALFKKDEKLQSITQGIATPGTFTLDGLEQLRKDNGIKAWASAMEGVWEKL